MSPLTWTLAGGIVNNIWNDETAKQAHRNTRSTERRAVALPARLTWKDQRGATRFATVVARNVSDFGVYVECHSPVTIPLYRLGQVPFERERKSTHRTPLTAP